MEDLPFEAQQGFNKTMYLKLFKLSKKSQIREEAEPLLPTRRQRRHPVSSLLRFHRCKSQTWRRTDGDKQQNKSHQDPHPTQSHPLPLSLFITWVLVWVFLCAGPTLSRPNDSRRCSRSPLVKWKLCHLGQNYLSGNTDLIILQLTLVRPPIVTQKGRHS